MSFDVDIVLTVGERVIASRFASDARLTALVGPSGVGKTSVLNAIAGLRTPSRGRIAVGGVPLFDADAGTDLPPERRHAGYVFQDTRLFPHRRVEANLAFAEAMAGAVRSPVKRAEVVEMLEIGELMRRWPATLSGGEARRVAIARALLSGPRFLLLDEPLASLDAGRAERLASLIERVRDSFDLPILLVSHSASEVDRLAGAVVEMR